MTLPTGINLTNEPTNCADFDTFTIQGTGATASESDGGVCLDDLTITVIHILTFCTCLFIYFQ